jgi:hypothetical protein
MSNIQLSVLQQEWVTLQNQFDSYEKFSLLIKLFNISITCLLLLVYNAGFWTLFVCASLWLQDGIWKTFQSRIGQRLEVIEQSIKSTTDNQQSQLVDAGMQFNLAWSQQRPSAVGLVIEYIKQSLKPTVAYPHVLLVVMIVIQLYV